ncbi:hypothetical protein A3A67_04555 [Candidatus Peribacteria bacterium RIFCSPLOWO2_01_FULL_51_18]|nr:MAG: hypothetical protein A3C52_03300 [Candidatus Peribacteria bacterium RIFCSPHIGHO2_02_FULL_51_15]OGJ66713.1 MAG: hypothetical protein A3A67_04555 [Candidatus Peribacteria bacterium RIFCSPLOWO2_01_FULL_51_18]OGJ69799.1 MAG: hypothetical protein A3J34_04875 [Candidatus Peribacteria bacterium RIFCSPLOWO2_02_FULL_51_10]
MIDPNIFRAYDIRGKADKNLTVEACRLVGAAFGEVLIEKYGKEHPHPSVVVGRDARTHSPKFEDALVEGLASVGCRVLRMGETPSPLNYFTICTRKLDGGVQITASHNPKEDNGIKLQIRNAEAFSGEDLQRLRERIEKKNQESFDFAQDKSRIKNQESGSVEEIDAVTPYLDFLEKTFRGAGKGKKIVIDTGNGIAGPVYSKALKLVGCEVTQLYTEPDGTFPNHPADPSKFSTLQELQRTVLGQDADLGFGFDGDGDRMGLVDERGSIVTADQTLLLLAQDHLRRSPGAPVIFTVSNSSLLLTEIGRLGGKPVMCKVGHSYVEHAMREYGAQLGGEQSGHFFCGEDYYGFDDALVAAMRVLSILQTPRLGKPLLLVKKRKSAAAVPGRGVAGISTLVEQFPKVYQLPELRPHCPDDKKADVTSRVTAHFQKKYPVNTLDGARVDFGDGAWAGIRFSNTSPCLSICMEARSEAKLKEIEREVMEHMRTYAEVEL